MLAALLIFSIVVIIVLILLSIFLKVLRKIVKMLFVLGFFITLFLLISGFLVFKDFQEFRQKSNETMLYLLEDQGEVVAGFSSSWKEGDFVLLKQPELSKISENISKMDYKSVLNGYYKIFMFDIQAIELNIKDSVELNGQNFSKDFVISLLKSDDASEFYAAYVIKERKLPESKKKDLKAEISKNFGDNAGLKSVFFASALTSIMKENSLFMALESSAGRAHVYPETPLFKALRIIPSSWMKNFSTNISATNISLQKINLLKSEE